MNGNRAKKIRRQARSEFPPNANPLAIRRRYKYLKRMFRRGGN